MLPLLKIEWLKIKHYRTFWILSILFIISIFGVNYIAYQVQLNKPKDPMANALLGSPFQFPEVWQTVSYMSGFVLFLPGLLIINSITNEYNFKTHRQNIIDGWSRQQFILVKMLLAVIIAFVSTLAVFFISIGFGLQDSAVAGAGLSLDKVEYIGYFFAQALSYTSIALLFGLLLKRSGLAIGLFFIYAVILDRMLSGLLNHYLQPTGYYLPLRSVDNLIPFPFLKKIVNQFVKTPDTGYLLLAACIYLALYFFLAKKKFETSDL